MRLVGDWPLPRPLLAPQVEGRFLLFHQLLELEVLGFILRKVWGPQCDLLRRDFLADLFGGLFGEAIGVGGGATHTQLCLLLTDDVTLSVPLSIGVVAVKPICTIGIEMQIHELRFQRMQQAAQPD
jgi:hypothetical protein